MNLIRRLNQISLDLLAEIMWEQARKTFLEGLQVLLEHMDDLLAEHRDKDRYELKDRRYREVTTQLGTVRFRRRYYLDREEGVMTFLLDEALGLASHVRVADSLRNQAVEAGVKGRSYRGAADEIERQAVHRAVSHEAIRQWTIQAGTVAQQQGLLYRTDGPRRKVKRLFIELDGFWPALQRSGKREEKIAVVHEGWRQKRPGSDDYELINRQDIVDGGQGDFTEVLSAYLHEHYDLTDAIVVINGDRAVWIRRGRQWFPQAIYQVDRWHLMRDLRECLAGQPERYKAAVKALDAGDASALLHELSQALPGTRTKQQRKRLRSLYNDLRSMPEAIVDYRWHLKRLGHCVEDCRGMGAAEGAVSRYSSRVRQVGRAWSATGLRAMLHMLAADFQGRLRQAVTAAERWAGLEPLRYLQQHAQHRAAAAVHAELTGARNAKVPTLAMGTTGSGGLSKLFRDITRSALQLS